MATITASVPPRAAPTRMLTLPGAGRVVMRRSAKDPSSGLTAYLVKENNDGLACNISVALKRKDRYIGTVLKGHNATVVDMEFLATPPDSPIFTLGTCDQNGVVYLWFLRLAKDALGIDYAIKQLRKYSFYSLRKNEAAFYNRIRLSGTPHDGTMVLVPNDGSSVRVISFSCEPIEDPNAVPQIEAPPAPSDKDSVPQIEDAPPPPIASKSKKEDKSLDRQPPPAPPPPKENKKAEQQIETPQPLSQDEYQQEVGKLGKRTLSEENLGKSVEVEGEEDDEQDRARDPLNSTFPMSKHVEEVQMVDDDIAEAAARGAGITDSPGEPRYRSDAAVEELEDGGANRGVSTTGVYEAADMRYERGGDHGGDRDGDRGGDRDGDHGADVIG